jgi:hypothetical protein
LDTPSLIGIGSKTENGPKMDFFLYLNFFTKNSPIFSIFGQNLQSIHTFQSIFHALHESINKNKKIFFLAISDSLSESRIWPKTEVGLGDQK